jgi:hypothetical protein
MHLRRVSQLQLLQYLKQIKDKTVPVLLTEHHAMKAYWRVKVKLHAVLTSALDGSGQLHAPTALPQGKESLVPIR